MCSQFSTLLKVVARPVNPHAHNSREMRVKRQALGTHGSFDSVRRGSGRLPQYIHHDTTL
jgi:hypothetical protein